MAQHPRIERRCFLRVVAAGSAAGALASGCSSGPSGLIPAGNVSDLAVGSLQAVHGESVAIGRDDSGVYAMTIICPHANCDMESSGRVSASEVFCSCHGSRFDANGGLLQGPARSPLDHFAVSIDAAGAITIDADAVVDSTERTAVGVTA